jgi:hypothetical protein
MLQQTNLLAGKKGAGGWRRSRVSMLSKNGWLEAAFQRIRGEWGGVVLGARVPIMLTSRANGLLARTVSCALAQLFVHRRRERSLWVPPATPGL